mmetsp:Transcript_39868/g.78517  ORF Transcript_39868/g.78517 Transcript_39868/m.78517 type:complete len:204 (-) Transcript_39868:2-613(-)
MQQDSSGGLEVQKRRGTSNDTEGAESASTQVAGGGVGSQESGRVGSHSRQGEEEEEEWVDVPFVPGSIVVNLGDALEHLTGGLLRATPHRVRPQRSAQGGVAAPSPARLPGRLSFPFFFDPSFESPMTSLVPFLSQAQQSRAALRREAEAERWDGKKVGAFVADPSTASSSSSSNRTFTYGDYVMSKVSKVFPALADAAHLTQ